MKKLFLSLIVFVFATGAAMCQHSLPKGGMQIDAGIGISNYTTPIYVGFDYAVHKDMTVGAELTYRDRSDYWRVIGITGNWNYHFNSAFRIPNNWDVYAGFKAGFMYYSNYAGYTSNSSTLYLAAQVGGRWFFTNTLGVNLELGLGNAFTDGRLGLTIKL